MEFLKKYYMSGFLEYEYNYVNHKKNGLFKKYHMNGILEFECDYINGKMSDEFKLYDINGNYIDINGNYIEKKAEKKFFDYIMKMIIYQ